MKHWGQAASRKSRGSLVALVVSVPAPQPHPTALPKGRDKQSPCVCSYPCWPGEQFPGRCYRLQEKLAGFKEGTQPQTPHGSLTLRKYKAIFVNTPPGTCVHHYLTLLSVRNYRLCPAGLLLV